MSIEAREASNTRVVKIQKLVFDFKQAEEQRKATAASEAELDKYRLHRRFWEEDKGLIPKGD
jgi:hypothetical protein